MTQVSPRVSLDFCVPHLTGNPGSSLPVWNRERSGERAWQWVRNPGGRGRERIQAVPRPKQRGKSNFRKWGPLGPPLLKEPGGLLEENDCVREPSPQFKGKAGDSLRQKEKGNLWALAAVGTGAAGWGTGGEESLAQRELAPSLPSTTTFPLPWTCSGWSLVLQPASCSGPGSQVTEDGWAQEKVSKGCHRVFGRLSGSRDQHWQP